MDELQNIFVGERLRELRLMKGKTQEDVAKHFGISKQAVSKWETGQSLPDVLLLPEIAGYFGVNISDFFKRSAGNGTSARPTGTPVIQVKGLKKKYNPKVEEYALQNVDMDIFGNLSTAIMGPSGSGKSTLLNCMSGLESPTDGSVIVLGKEISRLKEPALTQFRRKNINFIFQQYNLVDTLNVTENIRLPYKLSGEKTDNARFRELIDKLGLAGKEKSLPSRLSGGQQQRVAVARALLGKNRIIFADEPTGALDIRTGQEVLNLLLVACRQFQLPLVVVTHDASVAAACDVVYFLKDGRFVRTVYGATAEEISRIMMELQR